MFHKGMLVTMKEDWYFLGKFKDAPFVPAGSVGTVVAVDRGGPKVNFPACGYEVWCTFADVKVERENFSTC